MKTLFHPLSLWKFGLCFILLINGNAMAQNTSSTNLDAKIFYYGFALAIIALVVATILVLQKARSILGEQGQPLFQFEFSIFKRMTKARTTVAIVMILLVLWGMYLVITYKASQ